MQDAGDSETERTVRVADPVGFTNAFGKLEQAARELLEPVGYPELSEQAIVDRHIEEQEQEFVERYGYRPFEKRPKPEPTEEDDDGEEFMVEHWDDDPGYSPEGY